MPSPATFTFQAQIKTNARRSELVVDGQTVRILVNAPPVEGRANEEAIRVIAKSLRVPRTSVELIRGRRHRTKQFRVTGIEDAPDSLQALLERRK